jgi:DNA-binding SARP family transcriptional activator
VASGLWEDSTTPKSKKYLRQALWLLQHAFEPYQEQTRGPLLLVEPEWVRLNPRATYWLDVAAFEGICAIVQEIPGPQLVPAQVEALQEAVCIYRGDLLEGRYDDWCLFERERLQNIYLAMLDKLMAYHEAHGETETALAYGAQILRYDQASERTHWRLMRLYYRAGNRTAALRQYHRCVGALDRELGVRPGQRIAGLYLRIRTDRPALAGRPARTALPRAPSSHPIPELYQTLKCFQELRAALGVLYQQVDRDIQAIERTLQSNPHTPPR